MVAAVGQNRLNVNALELLRGAFCRGGPLRARTSAMLVDCTVRLYPFFFALFFLWDSVLPIHSCIHSYQLACALRWRWASARSSETEGGSRKNLSLELRHKPKGTLTNTPHCNAVTLFAPGEAD